MCRQIRKSRALANHPAARAGLAQRLRRPLGVVGTEQERNLGVDFSGGKRVGRAARAQRLQMARRRLRRVCVIKTGESRKQAARRVAKTGLQTQRGLRCWSDWDGERRAGQGQEPDVQRHLVQHRWPLAHPLADAAARLRPRHPRRPRASDDATAREVGRLGPLAQD